MIKLQVIGNLGKDCLTNVVNGKNVINFNVAHTERFRDQQNNLKKKPPGWNVLIGQIAPVLLLTCVRAHRCMWRVHLK